ncbi:MAG: nuclear transport factor 2 family protein [Gemmatimonadales bacterium]|nr:nuclear transport factor 2 family protein [Gemmatimonadales bacterium]
MNCIPSARIALALLIAAPLAAQTPQADSLAVAATVRAYHAALGTGDSTTALRLLAPDAVILESGGVESREDYHAGHLEADISYAMALPSVRGEVRVVVEGDVAWASSTSTTQGRLGERQVNAVGAELMVLSRSRDGWQIRAIHWSSRNRRSGS